MTEGQVKTGEGLSLPRYCEDDLSKHDYKIMIP